LATIKPFQPYRYTSKAGDPANLLTQPYDKINPAMQAKYLAASPYNLVRVILGERDSSDNSSDNVYTRAADTLKEWRKEHILAEESEPALYGYSQTYTVPHTDEVRERRGFIALGHLYDYADKVVYRHEQTFPKHKSDRMSLFKATRAYCEQIYMLYSDPAFTAEKLIFGARGPNGFDDNPADLAITDEYGVVAARALRELTTKPIEEQIAAPVCEEVLPIEVAHRDGIVGEALGRFALAGGHEIYRATPSSRNVDCCQAELFELLEFGFLEGIGIRQCMAVSLDKIDQPELTAHRSAAFRVEEIPFEPWRFQVEVDCQNLHAARGQALRHFGESHRTADSALVGIERENHGFTPGSSRCACAASCG